MSDSKQPEAAPDSQQLTDAELTEISGGKPAVQSQATAARGSGKVSVQDFHFTKTTD